MQQGEVKKSHIILVALVVGALAIVIQAGWQPSISFSTGSIEIIAPRAGSVVFLDGKEKKRTESENKTVVLKRVSAGQHSVLVAPEGFWPWAKTVTLQKGERVMLASFHIAELLDEETLLPGSERHAHAATLLRTVRTPSATSPTLSADTNIELWLENNKIFVSWRDDGVPPRAFCLGGECSNRIEVLAALSNIIHAEFLAGRSDVVVFSIEEGIFAIEIDTSETQNFQPIIRTESPRFAQTSAGLFVQTPSRISFIALP